jgi:hypothetical protein
MEESKRKRDSRNKPENDEETLQDLDKKQRAKTDEKIAAEIM